jgi:hypothetical protein
MIEKIQVAWQVWDWLSTPVAAGIFASLFAVSEALAAIPQVQSNSVFQAVSGILKKLAKK